MERSGSEFNDDDNVAAAVSGAASHATSDCGEEDLRTCVVPRIQSSSLPRGQLIGLKRTMSVITCGTRYRRVVVFALFSFS